MVQHNPFEGMTFTPEERAQLNVMLEEGEQLEQELGFHPIVRHTIHLCLEEDGETFRSELPEDRLQAVIGFLDEVHAKAFAELGEAVFGLLRLSAFLDQELEVGKSAYQLLNIANDAVVRFDLLATIDSAAVEGGGERDRQRALTGDDNPTGAPKLGEAAPEGAISLDKLAPRRKI